jgi:CHASE1-domain containing sensor protein
MATGTDAVRYVVKYHAPDKFWYVTENGLALGFESKSEEAVRKYCSKLNRLVNV